MPRIDTHVLTAAGLIGLSAGTAAGETPDAPATIHYRVHDEALHTVDPRIFGQFLEIASWGELGPEAWADPETGDLPEAMVEMLDEMGFTFVRFPGGIDIDRVDWTDRIDNAPGRPDEYARPVSLDGAKTPLTNRFGYDEYFELAERLGWETTIPVNLFAGVDHHVSLQQAALHAAGLVAYVNAPVGAELPEGMPDWPSVRAANGHAKPWGVRVWQIGNEVFGFARRPEWMGFRVNDMTSPQRAELAERLIQAVVVYADTMREVDPEIELIFDGWLGHDELTDPVLSDPRVRERIDWITIHRYDPWGIKTITVDGEVAEPEAAGLDRLWHAWVSMPAGYDDAGRAVALPMQQIEEITAMGYGVASTEWNWNGWGGGTNDLFPTEASLAKGLGAAGYLHGLIRQGQHIRFANQSMLLGHSWNIPAIKTSLDGGHPPFVQPTGLVTSLYARHHGDRRLRVEARQAPRAVEQDVRFNQKQMHSPLPLQDVVVTRSDEKLFVHAINRDRTEPVELVVDLPSGGWAGAAVEAHRMQAKPSEARVAPGDAAHEVREAMPPLTGNTLRAVLPAATVSVIEVTR